jgi:hypothetical protein
MSKWSDQWHVRDRSPPFLLDTNKDPHWCTQHAATTFSCAEADLIYFHNFAKFSLPPFPYPNPPKEKLYAKTQMKTNIDLWQNWDQSATIWWSTQCSAWYWWGRKWHLTLNESTDNNRKPTLMIRDILSIGWCNLRENHFFLTDILFWRNWLPPSSERFLKTQTVNSSETPLSRSYVILTQTLCLFTNAKSWSKNLVNGSRWKIWITCTTLCS